MNVKQFAAAVHGSMASPVGFDLSIILTIIEAIFSFLKSCKKDDVAEAKALTKLVEKHGGICPPRVRKIMKTHGTAVPKDQDKLWSAIVTQARAQPASKLAAMMASVTPKDD